SSRRRHTRFKCDWSSDVCSSDLLTGAADMDDVRLVMEQATQAMAAEVADHAHALRLDEALDRMSDVAGGGAGLHRSDAAHHRFEIGRASCRERLDILGVGGTDV